MPTDLDGDLGVDVLIVGAGLQGLYLARELARTYSVCVVSDPDVSSGTLDSTGYFSAGYDGNDVNRIQPARRAAGWWRLWAESNGVPFAPDAPRYVVAPIEVGNRTRVWADAQLAVEPAEALPTPFEGGSLADGSTFVAENDLVMHPATVLTRLRQGLEDRCLEGEVVRFGLLPDGEIDHVQVQVGDVAVPIVPRFVVLAAGVGNATLLTKLSSRLPDQAKRKATKELVDGCQAVRAQTVLCVSGPDLPRLSGRFGDLSITAHELAGGTGRIWLIEPPIDDSQTTLGPANLRFELPVDDVLVAAAVADLFAVSPALADQRDQLQWSVYVTRLAQHPMLAVPDASVVAQPVPAKLEKLGLESFMAVWPSHLAYAQFVGDSVAERVGEALGPAQDFSDGPQPADVGASAPELRARWDRDDFPWQAWSGFAAAHGITSP
ncbi:MAG TPA: FAD-dependent oxidoreductase [Acidimicrobiales bacterium]